MKHVIVSGGAGFIGSHLCDALLLRGYAVTAVDNLVTGRMNNISDALTHPYFNFLRQDICEPLLSDSSRFLLQYGLYGILHFACPASPVDFDRIPFEILKVDSLGTIQTVDLALQYKSRYLVASTSEVYGDPLIHPQPESYWGNVNPNGPRACYDETKRFAEAYVSTATRLKGLNGGIVRIFNTYGPRMRLDDGRLVPELCKLALDDKPLTIHGNGMQTRSLCYVSDLIEGIVRLFESTLKEPTNLGNPEERTILEFAEIVKHTCSSKAAMQFLPARPDDPKKRCPDITRARQLLDWSPQVNIHTGLKKSLEYFRAHP